MKELRRVRQKEPEYQVKKWLKEQTRDQRRAKERGFHHKRSELLGL